MKRSFFLLALILLWQCSTEGVVIKNETTLEQQDPSNDPDEGNNDPTNTSGETYRILSLGDSYTIGESVCNTCNFPSQLKDSLITRFPDDSTFELDIIAQTGWTTSNLLEAIDTQNPNTDHDVVTLLIGVNNQYQGKPFSIYTQEFPELVNKAIAFAQNDSNKVVVLSIPDYAYTPFGQNNGDPTVTSMEIDMYNAFAETYCDENGIAFITITDITREGLNNEDLVASDGLHPSELAYALFVERLLPIIEEKIN